MTPLLPAAATVRPAVTRPVLPCPVIPTEHFREIISQQQREKHMHTTQREEEEGDNDRFNAVSHKHALIRAEG